MVAPVHPGPSSAALGRNQDARSRPRRFGTADLDLRPNLRAPWARHHRRHHDLSAGSPGNRVKGRKGPSGTSSARSSTPPARTATAAKPLRVAVARLAPRHLSASAPPKSPGQGMPHLGLRAPDATAPQAAGGGEARRPRCEPSRLPPSSEQWTARWMLPRHRPRHGLPVSGHRRQTDP
jgi:hypothetical protein